MNFKIMFIEGEGEGEGESEGEGSRVQSNSVVVDCSGRV